MVSVAKMARKSVLFVCFGNIHRSPMAECIFIHEINERGISKEWDVISAGTSVFNLGMPPDAATAVEHCVCMGLNVKAQHVRDDFFRFDYILCMDDHNLRKLETIKPPDSAARVALLGNYDPKGNRIIKDPYKGTASEFEDVYEQCKRSINAFLDSHVT